MNSINNLAKAKIHLKKLVREQELQNEIRKDLQNDIQKSKKYIEALEGLIPRRSNQLTVTADANEKDNAIRNKDFASSKLHQYQPSAQTEDLYHTLLELGIKQDHDDLSDNKHMENVAEIVNILKHYNTLAYAIDTLAKTQSDYQIINITHNNKPAHFDIVYKDPKNRATESVSNSWSLQYAKYDIEDSLLNRIMDTLYLEFTSHAIL